MINDFTDIVNKYHSQAKKNVQEFWNVIKKTTTNPTNSKGKQNMLRGRTLGQYTFEKMAMLYIE